MLQISRKVHKAVKKFKIQSSKFKIKKSDKTLNSKLLTPDSLLHELWKGQCNDAYWHGIFGGLYLPHLRSSLYRHLLSAESMAEEVLKGQRVKEFVEEGDLDCDGFRDICISKGDMTAFFTEDSGALIELSSKEKQVNVLDVLTRRPEAYHSRISETSQHDSGEPKTIHDPERLGAKESGITDYLIYDNYRRASLLDHFFDYNIRLDELMRSEYDEKGDFIGSPYLLERINERPDLGIRLSREGLASGNKVKIDKSVSFRKSGIRVDYLIEGRHSGIFATEFNLSF